MWSSVVLLDVYLSIFDLLVLRRYYTSVTTPPSGNGPNWSLPLKTEGGRGGVVFEMGKRALETFLCENEAFSGTELFLFFADAGKAVSTFCDTCYQACSTPPAADTRRGIDVDIFHVLLLRKFLAIVSKSVLGTCTAVTCRQLHLLN